jgi:hypothetical protein
MDIDDLAKRVHANLLSAMKRISGTSYVNGVKEPAPARGMVLAKPGFPRAYLRLQELFFYFKESITDSINYFFEFRCFKSQNLAENF